MNELLTVGEIARMTGVTVRTLHHYDEIGLVRPEARTDAGYRLYGPREIERLQEVLFFRELGFSLHDMRRIIDDPGYDRAIALQRQRQMIEAKAGQLLNMLDAIDAALAAERTGTQMSNDDLLGVFGEFDPAEYEEEVKERWGNSDAFRESARRTGSYGRAEWERIGAASAAIEREMASLLASGADPSSEAAMDLAEQHRAHITRWFYECTPQIHAGLGAMYVADPRFTEHYERIAPGLAAFLAAAIEANAERLGG